MHEGLHNTPKLYGSRVRDKGKVTDFESGVKEGGKVGMFRSYIEMPADHQPFNRVGLVPWILRRYHGTVEGAHRRYEERSQLAHGFKWNG